MNSFQPKVPWTIQKRTRTTRCPFKEHVKYFFFSNQCLIALKRKVGAAHCWKPIPAQMQLPPGLRTSFSFTSFKLRLFTKFDSFYLGFSVVLRVPPTLSDHRLPSRFLKMFIFLFFFLAPCVRPGHCPWASCAPRSHSPRETLAESLRLCNRWPVAHFPQNTRWKLLNSD